ncbi:hypothetical protein [Oceanivirga miroungae]|uniref:Uncharacterized protein n=1 Tax=Oceanivirga miroungae TaxID=1130046 RepID=A0A6I8M8H2_9FUSO|nr:hypothetical protein [Oceanivirga miroungae]VWL85814.1 hypothetical protein OMES3154_01101 [Oceanivirga miroungae]
MQVEEKEYELEYNIDDIYNLVFDNRKKIVEKDDIYTETIKENIENKRLYYILESKFIKFELDFTFHKISKNSTKIKVYAAYKYRHFITDLFSYLNVNVEHILDDYIKYIEEKINK